MRGRPRVARAGGQAARRAGRSEPDRPAGPRVDGTRADGSSGGGGIRTLEGREPLPPFRDGAISLAMRPLRGHAAAPAGGTAASSGRRGSNSQQSPWKGGALPVELRPREGPGKDRRPCPIVSPGAPHPCPTAPRRHHARQPSPLYRRPDSATETRASECRLTSSRCASLRAPITR